MKNNYGRGCGRHQIHEFHRVWHHASNSLYTPMHQLQTPPSPPNYKLHYLPLRYNLPIFPSVTNYAICTTAKNHQIVPSATNHIIFLSPTNFPIFHSATKYLYPPQFQTTAAPLQLYAVSNTDICYQHFLSTNACKKEHLISHRLDSVQNPPILAIIHQS